MSPLLIGAASLAILAAGMGLGWLLGRPRSAGPNVRASDMPGLVVTDGSFVPMKLDRDDLLVLFEWAMRFADTGKFALSHPAEAVVLDKIGGELERFMVEPFQADYAESLKAARERVWAATRSEPPEEDWIAKLPLEQV